MKLLNVLLFAAFIFSAGNSLATTTGIQDDCDKIAAETLIESTPDGYHKATIKVTKGNSSGAKYIFCDEKGKVLNEGKFNTESIEKLKKGSYFCIVTTSECSKKISFTVE